MMSKISKVEAIKKVMEDFNGIATWEIIYNNIEKYYPDIKNSEEWKAGIRGVLYRELNDNKHFKKIDTGAFALKDYDESRLYPRDIEYTSTDKDIITRIRIGQGKYREKLLEILTQCPITGIDEEQILVASHIKPWCVSSDKERLDINNGLILSATIDKLFDRGFITFTKDHTILISKKLSQDNIRRIGISEDRAYQDLPIKNRERFLDFHHEHIFLK